jgi:hypothetical protein
MPRPRDVVLAAHGLVATGPGDAGFVAREPVARLGALLLLLAAATAFAGPRYGVDPFDQPGVEEAKRLTIAARRDPPAPPASEGPHVY